MENGEQRTENGEGRALPAPDLKFVQKRSITERSLPDCPKSHGRCLLCRYIFKKPSGFPTIVLRSPFSVLRSPFSVLRSPLSVLRSLFSVLCSLSILPQPSALVNGKKGKKTAETQASAVHKLCRLLCSRSAYRASVSASTALDASVSVDNILGVALSDSAYRALVSASTAGNAIFGNLISHKM